ncbi:MAG: hypothetical protein IIY21_06135 [Clostridiales bacterium]|nr:hypothetical protein [Clostridiales bacterium]
MAKYTVHWYTESGNAGSETFEMTQKEFDGLKALAMEVAMRKNYNILEFAVYNAKGVLLIDEKWDRKKKRWVSLIKTEKDKDWHPFGL